MQGDRPSPFNSRHHCVDMLAPRLERSGFLLVEAVALIDTDDAAAASARVAENRFNHLEVSAEPLEAGGDRAA